MRMPEVKRQIEAAILAERRRCQEMVVGCTMTETAPIGPLYGAGWNGAVGFISQRLLDQPRPSITILRPETAIQYPEKVTEHTIVAGQALIDDRIVDRKRTPRLSGVDLYHGTICR